MPTQLNRYDTQENQALKLFESRPLSIEAQLEVRMLAQWIKEELQTKSNRVLPERAQKTCQSLNSVFIRLRSTLTVEETGEKRYQTGQRSMDLLIKARTSGSGGLQSWRILALITGNHSNLWQPVTDKMVLKSPDFAFHSTNTPSFINSLDKSPRPQNLPELLVYT